MSVCFGGRNVCKRERATPPPWLSTANPASSLRTLLPPAPAFFGAGDLPLAGVRLAGAAFFGSGLATRPLTALSTPASPFDAARTLRPPAML